MDSQGEHGVQPTSISSTASIHSGGSSSASVGASSGPAEMVVGTVGASVQNLSQPAVHGSFAQRNVQAAGAMPVVWHNGVWRLVPSAPYAPLTLQLWLKRTGTQLNGLGYSAVGTRVTCSGQVLRGNSIVLTVTQPVSDATYLLNFTLEGSVWTAEIMQEGAGNMAILSPVATPKNQALAMVHPRPPTTELPYHSFRNMPDDMLRPWLIQHDLAALVPRLAHVQPSKLASVSVKGLEATYKLTPTIARTLSAYISDWEYIKQYGDMAQRQDTTPLSSYDTPSWDPVFCEVITLRTFIAIPLAQALERRAQYRKPFNLAPLSEQTKATLNTLLSPEVLEAAKHVATSSSTPITAQTLALKHIVKLDPAFLAHHKDVEEALAALFDFHEEYSSFLRNRAKYIEMLHPRQVSSLVKFAIDHNRWADFHILRSLVPDRIGADVLQYIAGRMNGQHQHQQLPPPAAAAAAGAVAIGARSVLEYSVPSSYSGQMAAQVVPRNAHAASETTKAIRQHVTQLRDFAASAPDGPALEADRESSSHPSHHRTSQMPINAFASHVKSDSDLDRDEDEEQSHAAKADIGRRSHSHERGTPYSPQHIVVHQTHAEQVVSQQLGDDLLEASSSSIEHPKPEMHETKPRTTSKFVSKTLSFLLGFATLAMWVIGIIEVFDLDNAKVAIPGRMTSIMQAGPVGLGIIACALYIIRALVHFETLQFHRTVGSLLVNMLLTVICVFCLVAAAYYGYLIAAESINDECKVCAVNIFMFFARDVVLVLLAFFSFTALRTRAAAIAQAQRLLAAQPVRSYGTSDVSYVPEDLFEVSLSLQHDGSHAGSIASGGSFRQAEQQPLLGAGSAAGSVAGQSVRHSLSEDRLLGTQRERLGTSGKGHGINGTPTTTNSSAVQRHMQDIRPVWTSGMMAPLLILFCIGSEMMMTEFVFGEITISTTTTKILFVTCNLVIDVFVCAQLIACAVKWNMGRWCTRTPVFDPQQQHQTQA
eukprot:m.361082 g.361082  ORF g.361082 m.361082 type:complete len:989 (-) comp19315_c0_seq1:479-3445(-)